MLNVIFLAWGVPLYQIGFQLRLRDTLIGIVTSIFILLIVNFAYFKNLSESEHKSGNSWRMEALWVGLLTTLASVLPVIAVNRHIDFAEFSRYALPGSVGGVVVLTSLLYYLESPQIRIGTISVLIVISTLTHHANVVQAVNQSDSVRDFWWQVSWRIPQIKEGTTLVARYAGSGIPEDYVVWGPANIIYYPGKHIERPVQTSLSAIILSNENVARIIVQSNATDDLGRATISIRNYKNILVMSQSSTTSCVHVIDGRLPEYSLYEDYGVMLVASNSNIANVLINQSTHIPPNVIFGPEPEHDWCFYFQKADLARQIGDWNKVAQLGDEAQKLGLHPNDLIEWMPFLQAYAILGNEKEVKDLSKRINIEVYYKRQVCQIMTSMHELGYFLSSEMDAHVRELFCLLEQ